MSSLLQAIAATDRATHTALDGPQGSLSYAELALAAATLAEFLSKTGQPPRVLALALANLPAWVVADLAAGLLNCPCLPIPGFFSPAQQRHALLNAGAELLLTDRPGDFTDLALAGISLPVAGTQLSLLQLPHPAVTLPPGTAKITYTSGTTGQPKGVCLSQAGMEQVARSLAEAVGMTRNDRHLCLLPLATLLENIGGIYAPLLAGATTILRPAEQLGLGVAGGFDPVKLLGILAETRASTAILMPQMLLGLTHAIEQGAPLPPQLRFLAVGGASVSPRLLARAAQVGLPVFEGYGLSECASVVCLNTPAANRPGSVGRPLPHSRISLAADGEVLAESPALLGYAGDPTPPPRPWPTGDLGSLDPDGYLHLTGRKKHLIITAYGRNLSPEWVEKELLAEGLAQAVVFGEGQPSCSAVVLAANTETAAAAITRANAGLPDYARIAHWCLADAPFSLANGLATANGRPRREQIWSQYRDRLEHNTLELAP